MNQPKHQSTPARPLRRVVPSLGMPYLPARHTDVRFTWAVASDAIRAAKSAVASAGAK